MSFLRKIKFAAAALVVSSGLGTSAIAATYNPTGVQNDVDVADVLGGGWSVLYSGLYNQNVSLASAFSGAGDMIMLAAKRVGSDTFDVLAAVSADLYIPLQTAANATVESNGALWYKNGNSMGFAGLGDTIRQNTADINGQSERDRLSWHTNWIGYQGGQNANDPAEWLSPGWRSGSNTTLNNSTAWERYILTANMSPVPVPASVLLLLGALGGMGTLRMRKRAA